MKTILLALLFSIIFITPAFAWEAYNLRSDYNSSSSGYRSGYRTSIPQTNIGGRSGDVFRVNTYGESWNYSKSTRVNHNQNNGELKVIPERLW